MSDPLAPETLIWCDPQREPLVRSVLGRMDGLQVLAIGGPRKGQLNDLARSLDCQLEDDIRKMLIDQPASYLLLATDDGVSREDLDQARRRGMHVLAVEPPVDQLDQTDLDRGRDEAMGRMLVVPWWRTSPAWQAAADPQEALGEIWSIEATSLCPPSHGSLYGRLYDALDMIVNLMGLPDMIDAALTGPLADPPQQLRHLTGALTAHLRFGEQSSAQLYITDRSSIWSRRMEVMGSEGQLRLCDGTYHLYSKGEPLDALESETDEGEEMDAGELIASQWRRLVQHGLTPDPIDAKAVVACAATILLSCRTGHGESPTTMLRMHGA